MNENEDIDMQQALSMSMSQTLEDQETGVTDGKNFKPAERSYYDPNSWSLVSRPIMPNPDPEYRKRPPGTPAFMKPTPRGHYLPALFTIFQQIPLAKEALLARSAMLQDYGMGEDWWDGESIRVRRVVLAESENAATQDVPLVIETQRIMAFLELTERAYGNVSVLGPLAESDDAQSSNSHPPESMFLESWRTQLEAITPGNSLATAFISTPRNVNTLDPETETEERAFGVATLSSPQNHQVESMYFDPDAMTLYDVLDAALWGVWMPGGPNQMYIEFGDILTFVIDQNTETQLGRSPPVQVPETLWVDRYMKENMATAKNMLEKQSQLDEKIKQVDFTLADSKSITTRRNETVDATLVLKIVQSFFADSESSGDEDDAEQFAKGQGYHDLESYADVNKQLQEVVETVMAKFQTLEEERERMVKELRELKSLFGEGFEDKGESPSHPYTLRGVATDQNTTFVLANPNSTEDLIDTVAEEWEWWKISFDAGETQPINYEVSKAPEELCSYKCASR